MRLRFPVLTALLLTVGFVCSVAPETAIADAATDGFEKLENRYLVYFLDPPHTFPDSLLLLDQFGAHRVDSLMLDRYANPVDKNEANVIDPLRHHTWWLMDPPNSEPTREVSLANQFGPQELIVRDGRYLLLPSLKNENNDPLPDSNHYECYDAEGPPVDADVLMIDQYGLSISRATFPLFFCNPVQKIIGEMQYPIVDDVYLTCYALEPPPLVDEFVLAFDQFGIWDFHVSFAEWLCVPTQKFGAVPTEAKSWGEIKSRYR